MAETLLVVDDEPDIRRLTRLTLERLGGYTVLDAGSGAEALTIATNQAVDAVLLDVMMPGMDGLETLRRLQAAPATAQIPVLFVTARAQPHEVASYRAAGGVDVIAKPFEPAELVRRVQAVLEAAPGR